MSAYATSKRVESRRMLSAGYTAPALGGTKIGRSIDATRAVLGGTSHVAGSEGAIVDSLLERLVDRVAAAVVERLCSGHVDQKADWLDSREAAEYLGMHRDTLRRLAAARAIPSEQEGRGCKLSSAETPSTSGVVLVAALAI